MGELTFAHGFGWLRQVLVGDCPGVAVGVSPIVTLVYGPHTVRIDPMPLVPPSPPRFRKSTI